ncbi:hypothetical protein KCP76_20440 [Salmonella enterica subsp. enterica serovar Weltevreden]|nr:hypothetical protein KCP76_20440 [Salmonella enterica subsp. enterica serovar Weltevreden]
MGGKWRYGFYTFAALLHLGDGALRVADVRHTNRAGSRPNQHSGSTTEKWQRAFAWLILGILPGTPGPRKNRGYPADILSQKTQARKRRKVVADMSHSNPVPRHVIAKMVWL